MDSISCPSCGNDNAGDRRFCRNCGTSLALTCAACGRDNDQGDRFCGDCGARLDSAGTDAAPAPTAEERRMVTVMFADLAGYTPFSEERDAEDIRSMLTDYFDRCRVVIDKFGGTVDKFIGDAVMAVWGATAAREDDAERAVRAALELVDMVRSSDDSAAGLRLRAGVMTGESSVGPGGNAMGLVVGDEVNMASRLQSIAEPGAVLVGDTTYELTSRSIAYRPLGEHQVKGKARAVAAWQAIGIAARVGGAEHTEGIEPPFVGRDNEYRLLKDQLTAVEETGRARLVSLVGEAGIGKSRLAWELKKYADGLIRTIYWHHGRSPSYGDGLTFWALGEMVRGRAGIAEGDDEHRSRTKLRTTIVQYCPDPAEQRWVEPRLAGLLGLAEMPAGERSELFAALRSFFQRVAEQGPVVMVFEDLHWADDGLVEFVEELVERSSSSPILVLALARPEIFDRHPRWGTRHRHGVAMHLPPLSDAAMAELVRGTAPDLAEELVAQVVERADGVPLYAVEFIRMFQSDPSSVESAIPDSLRAVIGARIDRLDPEARSTIQDAAVLGLTFPPSSLAALRDESVEQVVERLRELIRQEVFEVDEDPRSPERGQFRFVQDLIREVAYARLGRAERKQRHLAVAEALGELEDPEVAAAIAAHYVAAHEAVPTDSSAGMLTTARRALHDAARRASSLHSHRQALGLCRQALAIPSHDELELDLLTLAAGSASLLFESDEAIDFATRALAIAEQHDEQELIVKATTRLGKVFNDHSKGQEALEALEPVYVGLSELRTEAQVDLAAEYARSFIFQGAFERVVPVIDRTLPAAEALGMYETIADALTTKAAGLGYLGRVQEAIALLLGAIRIAETHDLPRVAARASNNLAVEIAAENWRERLGIAERGAEFAERSGEEEYRLRMRYWRGDTLRAMGRLDEARPFLDVDTEPLDDSWTLFWDYDRVWTAMLTGEEWDTGEVRSLLDEMSKVDAQWAAIAEEWECVRLLFGGETEAAARHAVSAEHVSPYPLGLEAGLMAAVDLADRDLITRVGEKLSSHARSAGAVEVLRAWAAAARAAADGDGEQAVAGFTEAIAKAERVSPARTVAAIQASFWGLVGDADAAARQAGLEAARWLDQSGCYGFRAVWPELPAGAPEASAAG